MNKPALSRKPDVKKTQVGNLVGTDPLLSVTVLQVLQFDVFPLRAKAHTEQREPAFLSHRCKVICESCEGLDRS